MCGIAVAIDWDGAEAAVRRLTAGILHRGDITDPVASPRPGVALCTRRLRIVDADHAVQPQVSFDGRILVAFNGEIYNHAVLRRELETMGIGFRTSSDTEVLASALAVWGGKALQRLSGMFAFVAYDLSNGEFMAGRDPLGVKPLYLIQSGQGFLFCSEIKPLLHTVETGDVMLLPPGHVLTRGHCIQYAGFVREGEPAATNADPKVLDGLMRHAVQTRLPPDLPFATLFSGGIDSTLVAHYAREVRPEAPGYFLGGLEAPDYGYATAYANRTGYDLRHVELELGAEALSRLGDVVATLETFEPAAIRDSYSTYLIAKRIHEDGFRVALSGEGADELFAGYVPLEVAFDDRWEAGAYVRDQSLGIMHRTNLQRLDRCGMRFELEIREPFLDKAVVDHALGLSAGELVKTVAGQARGKAPLRSLYDLYPDLAATGIGDRAKVPMNEGAGLGVGAHKSIWAKLAEDALSQAAFIDGQRRFAAYDINTKEELLYIEMLAAVMDISRVPHLAARLYLKFPTVKNMDRVREQML